MKITPLGRREGADTVAVSARLTFEDTPRPPEVVVFETLERFGEHLRDSPEAYLLVGAMVALREGERRVAMDSEVCPDLLEGLRMALGVLELWDPERRPPLLDIPRGCAHPDGSQPAAFLAGGVDSLALLRFNHEHFPVGHPRRFTKGVVLRGIWHVAPYSLGRIGVRLRDALERLRPVAEDCDLSLIPMATNARDLAPDVRFFQYASHGALLAATAHALGGTLNSVSIASTWEPAVLAPWGSHPLLDPQYGHHSLRVRHELFAWPRVRKLALLRDWEVGLRHLHVCNADPEAPDNCGQCEKCVRSMLALEALGLFERASRFPKREISPGQVGHVRMAAGPAEQWYRELLPGLAERGRDDLVAAVEDLFERTRRRERRERLASLDHRYLNGAGRRLARRARSLVGKLLSSR